MKNTCLVLVGFAMLVGGACATPPAVTSEGLALKRVVIYRNGVAYFEREGRVRGSKVGFRVRRDEVGDFLASFAVMERTGGTVRAASFPMHREEETPPVPIDGKPAPAPRPDPKRKLENVVMELDGGVHDLAVGYIAEAPVWRPSYRPLPLAVAHQPQGVRGKRCALRCRPQDSADPVEVGGQPALSLPIKQVFHPHDVADFRPDWQLFQPVVLGSPPSPAPRPWSSPGRERRPEVTGSQPGGAACSQPWPAAGRNLRGGGSGTHPSATGRPGLCPPAAREDRPLPGHAATSADLRASVDGRGLRSHAAQVRDRRAARVSGVWHPRARLRPPLLQDLPRAPRCRL